MNLLKLKIRLKFILNNIISVLVIALLLFVAYLSNKLIETCITMILFYIFRKMFNKQYHSYSIWGCALVSIIVFLTIIKLEFNLSQSILFIVIITFIVNLISYYVSNYIEYKNKFGKRKSKKIENLTLEEMKELFPDVEEDKLNIVYGYFHRPKTLTSYGYVLKCNISERTLFRYVKEIKNNYESLD